MKSPSKIGLWIGLSIVAHLVFALAAFFLNSWNVDEVKPKREFIRAKLVARGSPNANPSLKKAKATESKRQSKTKDIKKKANDVDAALAQRESHLPQKEVKKEPSNNERDTLKETNKKSEPQKFDSEKSALNPKAEATQDAKVEREKSIKSNTKARSTKDDAVKARKSKTPNLQDLIDKRLGDQGPQGQSEGSELGAELSGRLRAGYNDKILASIRTNLSAPSTLSKNERIRLKTRIFIALDSNGMPKQTKVSKASGNSSFDNAVLQAVKKSTPFPKPPIRERGFYSKGVLVNVCPLRCK